MNDISITSRHLGLKLADEDENTNNKIQRIADIIKEKIDLEKLIELSKSKKITYKEKIYEKKYNVTLAVAKDKALSLKKLAIYFSLQSYSIKRIALPL